MIHPTREVTYPSACKRSRTLTTVPRESSYWLAKSLDAGSRAPGASRPSRMAERSSPEPIRQGLMAHPAFESELERANDFWHLKWSSKINENGSVRCTNAAIVSVLKSRKLTLSPFSSGLLAERLMGDQTDENWSLVLWLGHHSHRRSGYRLGCVRCLSSAHPSPGQESSWSTHTGLRCGRLAGRSGSCNLVAAQRKDGRRGIRNRLLDFCGIVATSVLCRDSCVWLANRVLLGVSFGLAQQLMLVAPAAIVYASSASSDSLLQKRAAIAARWMLGLPPVLFGLFHLIGHSRLRDHRPALDAVWIFLGGADRNRLHPGRNCNLLRNYRCPGRQTACVDVASV